MRSNNSNLHKAKVAQKDEFYTKISDIEKELSYYKSHFRGKVVLCNCDDPEYSNFWRYFLLNFKYLGLRKLIATHFDYERQTYKLESRDGKEANVIATYLEQNGDFRSPECVDILREADIVVTNPPFSLFREYIAQLIGYGKKFLIIGPIHAITYKETFKLIKENKIWLGYSHPKEFIQPNGERQVFGNIGWYTNLTHKKRNEKLILYKRYNPEEYPTYDNYDAIEVSKTKDIPIDYGGVMGVPISFLDKYNPEQFEILGMCENLDLYGLKTRVYMGQECRDRYFDLFGKRGIYDLNAAGVIDGKKVYQRLLIRHKRNRA